MDYLYTVSLPFTNTEIIYKELCSKQQLNLCKINILFPINSENSNIVEYSKLFKKIILECIENKNDFKKLNLIDYIFFITKLRIISIGSELNLILHSDEQSNKEIKITIDLNFFMKSLYQVCLECLNDNILTFNNLKIIIDWPLISSEEDFYTMEGNKTITSSMPKFIKTIILNEVNTIDFHNLETDQQIKIYDNLPVSVKNKLEQKIYSMIELLSNSNLFGIKIMDGFNFNFYNTSYQRFIRYLFSGNIRNIYQEYYILASKNINPEYVDKLSISDRTVYCSFIEEEVKARNESSNSNSDVNMTDLQKLMNEFPE